MNNECFILLLATLLGILHVCAAAGVATAMRGPKWNMGPRDDNPPPLPGKAGRFDRSLQNFKETFPFFVAAVLLITVSGKMGRLSEIMAWTYLVARIVYIPLYVFAVTGLRTLVWTVSVIGIVGVIAQIFIS